MRACVHALAFVALASLPACLCREELANYTPKPELRKQGFVDCHKPIVGTRKQHPPFPQPDFQSTYLPLEAYLEEQRALAGGNEEFHWETLRSRSPYSDQRAAKTEFVVFEKGGVSARTKQRLRSEMSDDQIENWLRDNLDEQGKMRRPFFPRGGRGVDREPGEKLRVFVSFGQHGRELMSTELGRLFYRTLAEAGPERIAEIFKGDQEKAKRFQQALGDVVFYTLACENESGRLLVEGGRQGAACWRKTSDGRGGGTDPNRNWPVHWGFKEWDYDPSEEYPGPAPVSEPESRNFLRAIVAAKPHVFLTIHTGMYGIFMPDDHRVNVALSARALSTLKLMRLVNEKYHAHNGTVGSSGMAVGYYSHGTTTDFVYHGLGVPITQTWEMYGDERAHTDDCYSMFNIRDKGEMQAKVQDWLGAMFEFVLAIHAGEVAGVFQREAKPRQYTELMRRLPLPMACGLQNEHLDLERVLASGGLAPPFPKEAEELYSEQPGRYRAGLQGLEGLVQPAGPPGPGRAALLKAATLPVAAAFVALLLRARRKRRSLQRRRDLEL